MTGLLGRFFGKKTEEIKDSVAAEGSAEQLVSEVLDGLFAASNLDLSYSIERDGERIAVEVSGDDEELLRTKEGQLLDAVQLFLTRVVQHQMKDERVNITVDNAGFREDSNKELIELAEKLKGIALEKGKPVYFRALPPRDRKIIHQHLAIDGRVKSRSVGDGLFKKIKIYPLKGEAGASASQELAPEAEA
jgi:spoIIIJ-associated protein